MPCVLAMYEIWKNRSFLPWSKYLKLAPYFILAALVTLATARLQLYAGSGFDISERLLIVFHNLAWYVMKNFYPGEMSPMYPLVVFGSRLTVHLIVFYSTAAVFMIFAALKNRKLFIYTVIPFLISYLAALAPTIGFVQIGTGIWDYADRYSYIPAGIAFTVVAAAADCFFKWKLPSAFFREKLLPGFLLGITIFFAVTTFFYNYTWKSYRNLLAVAAQYNPPNKYFLYCYGIAVCDEMKLEESERAADYILSTEKKGSRDCNGISLYYMALYIKARIAVKKHDYQTASNLLDEVTRHLKEFSFQQMESYINVLKIAVDSFLRTGRKDDALRCCDIIVMNVPERSVDFYFYRGLAFCMRDKPEKAVQEFRSALELSPGDPNIKANLERLIKDVNK